MAIPSKASSLQANLAGSCCIAAHLGRKPSALDSFAADRLLPRLRYRPRYQVCDARRGEAPNKAFWRIGKRHLGKSHFAACVGLKTTTADGNGAFPLASPNFSLPRMNRISLAFIT